MMVKMRSRNILQRHVDRSCYNCSTNVNTRFKVIGKSKIWQPRSFSNLVKKEYCLTHEKFVETCIVYKR